MLDTALLAAAGLAAAAYLSPYIATALGFSVLRYRNLDAAPTIDGDDHEFLQRVNELRTAGYAYTGTVRERGYLVTDRLVKTTDVPKYRSADGTTHVSLYRIIPGEPVRLAAASYAGNGSRVVTAMPGAELKFESDGGVRKEMPLGRVKDLLEAHAETSAEYAKKNRTKIQAVTLDDVAAREQASDALQLKDIGIGQAWIVLAVGWGLPAAFFFGLFAVTSGWPTARAAGIAGLIAAVAYPVFAWVFFPKFIAFADQCGAEEPAAEREVTTSSDRW